MTKYNIELIDFVDLTDKQKNMVLDMRNHPEIRKWMYNSNVISTEEHLNYIDTLIGEESKKYFLVTNDKYNIGIIYFTDIGLTKQKCELGLYANFFEKMSGRGNILLKLAIDYAFNSLKLRHLELEVFKNNERAISLYKKFNFKQTCKKVVDDHKIICMELQNENR